MRRRALLDPGPSLALVSLTLLVGCAIFGAKQVDDGMDVYFRETDLLELADQGLPQYPTAAAGESQRLGRDFPDAPPQIPHEIEDMYPITAEDNECLECHDPNNAGPSDIPLPESHFMSPVMAEGGANDPMVWVVQDYEKLQQVMGARYNCSMCHTPQAINVATPENRFQPPRR